jgi:hypothetical protein
MRRALTQTELRKALRAVMADAKPPRVIYAKPDGRERLVNVVRVLRSVLPGKRSA